MRPSLFLLSLVLLTASCRQKETEPLSINGVWQSVGSGWLLEITDSTSYSFYDITSISCLPNRQGAFIEIDESLILKGDTLELLTGVLTYKFARISQLPMRCSASLSDDKRKDPLYNFAVFGETVKEHYAFMDLNQINWQELYQTQLSKLGMDASEAELYLAIEETLEQLNDNHAYLEATDEVYEAVDQLLASEEVEEGGEDLPEYGDFQIANMVAQNHLDEDMTEDSWLINWGKLSEGIGYLQIKAMWLYADLEIPDTLIQEVGYVDAYVHAFHQMYEGRYIEKEVAGVNSIMDRVMHDLSNVESIVIDLRFNGGGQDAVSFAILSRFIPQDLQVATQKLYFDQQFSPTMPLRIQGRSDAFAGPVYLLISPQTGSAAESFALATMAMNDVKRIGSPTSGAMSTALEKTLPNGWAFSISNELFMDNDGVNYENVGVPVDHDLGYAKDRQTFFRAVANDLAGDRQSILDAISQ